MRALTAQPRPGQASPESARSLGPPADRMTGLRPAARGLPGAATTAHPPVAASWQPHPWRPGARGPATPHLGASSSGGRRAPPAARFLHDTVRTPRARWVSAQPAPPSERTPTDRSRDAPVTCPSRPRQKRCWGDPGR